MSQVSRDQDDGALKEISALVRAEIFRFFLDHGHGPCSEDVRKRLRISGAELASALGRLDHPGDIVVGPGSNNVLIAHPFGSDQSGYQVRCAEGRYWAPCAQDALMLGLMLDTEIEVDATCPDCQEPIHIELRDGQAYGDAIIHTLLPLSHWFENIALTCATTLFFKDAAHAARWCEQRGYEFGSVATLAQCVIANTELMKNRLRPDFRVPTDHQRQLAYAQAGLHGDFWNLRRNPAPPAGLSRYDDVSTDLTDREREVLQRLCGGESQKQIAYGLALSRHTVDTHVRNVYGKLRVHSRAAAVAMAIRLRLI